MIKKKKKKIGDDKMREQILEEFLKKQKKENPFAEEMVDSVELILNTLTTRA